MFSTRRAIKSPKSSSGSIRIGPERKFLAVKDQNTVKKYRNRRLMSLMHFFLLHRYKTDLVHYVTPNSNNRLSVQRMTHNGVFRSARTDDPNIIAIEVDTARAQKIFANDDSIKRFIAKRLPASDSRAVAPKWSAAG